MLRGTAGYLAVGYGIASAAGVLYGLGHISAAAVYGLVLVISAILAVGVIRWDLREFGDPRRR